MQIFSRGVIVRKVRSDHGVRQGCLLSPFLFLLMMDWIMKQQMKEEIMVVNGVRGYNWTTSTLLMI